MFHKKLTMVLIIVQILHLVNCRGNHTVHTACGPGNGCMGSMEDWVCLCEADGWKAVEGDMKKCHKSKTKFLLKLIRVLLQPWANINGKKQKIEGKLDKTKKNCYIRCISIINVFQYFEVLSNYIKY